MDARHVGALTPVFRWAKAGHDGCGQTRMTRFSFIYQKKVRDLFWQALVLGLTLGLLVFFILNASRNMREAGIASGFDFLWRTAGIEVPFVLTNYTPQSDNLALLWV